jgi:hypothetical protein
MTDRQPTLDDALYVLDAHKRTGCLHYATDYAERTRGFNRDRLHRGIQHILAGLQKAEDKRKAETQ